MSVRLVDKIHRKLKKLGKSPIRVFCIHHIGNEYNGDFMWEGDWVNTNSFKEFVIHIMDGGYQFIFLEECKRHLKNDIIRRGKYAVLTADDGYASIKTILPWLKERQIPITLFINPIVWDGKTIGQNLQSLPISTQKNEAQGLYLTLEDLKALVISPLVTLGYHGYEHIDEFQESHDTFVANFKKCKEAMSVLSNVIPFYAHTYGHTTKKNDDFLASQRITPVYVNGGKNYGLCQYIDRNTLLD